MPIVKLYGVSPVSPSPGFDSIGYSLATGCLLTAYCLWQVYYQISMDSSWKISRSFSATKKQTQLTQRTQTTLMFLRSKSKTFF